MASSLSSSSSLLLDPLGYTAYDDVSWAVRSNNLSSPVKQVEYNEFMESCREQAGDDSKRLCDDHESARIDMNVRQPQSVRAMYTVVVPVYCISRSLFE